MLVFYGGSFYLFLLILRSFYHMLVLASVLKNPNQDPIPNAALWIQEDSITFAGDRRHLPSEAWQDLEKLELENAALFPGLVNAHCHLELTALADLSYPGSFVEWIRKLLTAKNALSPRQQNQSLTKGILLSLMGGTTTVGDHISFNSDIRSLLNSPMRGKVFLEILGVLPEMAQEIFKVAQELKRNLASQNSLLELIPSPHSVHAVEPGILWKIFSQDHDLFSIHLAESQVEQEYFEKNNGPLYDFISERGSRLQRNSRSSIQELNDHGWLDDRILAIHGNYLSPEEFNLLGEKNISVVHCPLSHRYFGHRPFPLEEAQRAGVNLALGTDSLASAASLSMLEVLRQTQVNFPSLKKEEIFQMATLGGAKALKMEQAIGELRPGKKADMIGISVKDPNKPLEALFKAGQVDFSMINGNLLAR